MRERSWRATKCSEHVSSLLPRILWLGKKTGVFEDRRFTKKVIGDEGGYSLVEVMASIMILAVAIIPMVGMFDAGMNAATLGSNYDKARALANKQLERPKGLPYETVRDSFPTASSTPNGGSFTSASQSDGDFPGFTYTVTKRYKCLSSSTSSCNPATGATAHLASSSSDRGIMEITVTVTWGGGKTYTATGIKAR